MEKRGGLPGILRGQPLSENDEEFNFIGRDGILKRKFDSSINMIIQFKKG